MDPDKRGAHSQARAVWRWRWRWRPRSASHTTLRRQKCDAPEAHLSPAPFFLFSFLFSFFFFTFLFFFFLKILQVLFFIPLSYIHYDLHCERILQPTFLFLASTFFFFGLPRFRPTFFFRPLFFLISCVWRALSTRRASCLKPSLGMLQNQGLFAISTDQTWIP